jgi:hypothetical protein
VGLRPVAAGVGARSGLAECYSAAMRDSSVRQRGLLARGFYLYDRLASLAQALSAAGREHAARQVLEVGRRTSESTSELDGKAVDLLLRVLAECADVLSEEEQERLEYMIEDVDQGVQERRWRRVGGERLGEDETELRGKWTTVNGKVEPDETCHRIKYLIEHRLEFDAREKDGPARLYTDRYDGRQWVLSFPEGDASGGGPPMLSLREYGKRYVFHLGCPQGHMEPGLKMMDVMDLAERPPRPWPTTEQWGKLLPEWFVEACDRAMSREDGEARVARWQLKEDAERDRTSDEQPWSLAEWLYWMGPAQPGWRLRRMGSPVPTVLEVTVRAYGSPTSLRAFKWLAKTAGAEHIKAKS